jgi:hypothetical protein
VNGSAASERGKGNEGRNEGGGRYDEQKVLKKKERERKRVE